MGADEQAAALGALLTPLTAQIEAHLRAPSAAGPGLIIQAMEAVVRLSKGFKTDMLTRSRPQLGRMFARVLEVALGVPREYPTHRLLRARFISALHRLVEALQAQVLPYLPAALEVLVGPSAAAGASAPAGPNDVADLTDVMALSSQLVARWVGAVCMGAGVVAGHSWGVGAASQAGRGCGLGFDEGGGDGAVLLVRCAPTLVDQGAAAKADTIRHAWPCSTCCAHKQCWPCSFPHTALPTPYSRPCPLTLTSLTHSHSTYFHSFTLTHSHPRFKEALAPLMSGLLPIVVSRAHSLLAGWDWSGRAAAPSNTAAGGGAGAQAGDQAAVSGGVALN